MELNQQDTKTKKEPEKTKSWESTERIRPPWVLITHGEHIPPQCDQTSNQPLTDRDVLQSRTEPVGEGSYANPLRATDGRTGKGDEPSGAKRNYPTGRGGLGAQ